MSAAADDDWYDVAVVGFGPTGAVLAALLGQAGLKTWVGDRSREVYAKPRAIALDHEILRVFQQIGIVDSVLPYVEPFTPSEYFGVDGRLIKRLTMVEPPYPLGYTPSNVFHQPAAEAILRERVAALPAVDVDLGVEVMGVTQDASSATLRLRDEVGRERKLRARYVIGCDGASSMIRDTARLPLDDLQFDEPWLVVDVLVNERGLAKLPRTSVQYCNPKRPCTFVIGPRNHRRWEIALHPGEDPKLAATPDETWRHLAPWLTRDDGVLWRQASYRFHALAAVRWRAGRVFVAGDAAHQQPPFLGQGMCQGIRDSANLAWKLAAVCGGEVRGAAAEALLDTYGEERNAHVRELTTRIKAIGAVVSERDPAKARERDARLLAECNGTVRDVPRQDVIPRLEHGLLSTTRHRANGTLFVQPWLVRGQARLRFDDVAGCSWRLMVAHGFDAPMSLPSISGLRVCAFGDAGLVEADGVAADWFHRHGCGFALVRPDHYVFGVAATQAGCASMLSQISSRLFAM